MKKALAAFIALALLPSLSLCTQLEEERDLRGYKVAVLLASGFDYSELSEVKAYLELWGCKVTIAGLTQQLKAETGDIIKADILISELKSLRDYDGIFIPGGWKKPILPS